MKWELCFSEPSSDYIRKKRIREKVSFINLFTSKREVGIPELRMPCFMFFLNLKAPNSGRKKVICSRCMHAMCTYSKATFIQLTNFASLSKSVKGQIAHDRRCFLLPPLGGGRGMLPYLVGRSHPAGYRTAPTTRTVQPKMAVVPRLKSPV